ncbi:MAG: S8 family serine peptidase, partial [Longimicrobiales bacterium]
MVLSWSETATNESGFKIERCSGSGCSNFAEIAQVSANVTTYNNSGLAASTTYGYRVRAFNTAGSSKYSNIAQATTQAAPPPPPPLPAAPGNLSLSPVSGSQINLAWTDNSTDETGFRVERCQGFMSSCSNFVQVGLAGANVTSHSDTGLAAGTTYTYRVRAYNSAGNSGYSNSAEGTTPPSPPGTQVVPAGVQRIGAAPGAMSWTGAGVGVAIVDTGLDFSHPDLGLPPEVPGVNSFNSTGGSCQDIHGHGTHVAGIVAARHNTIDVVGVAPQAALYCVNVFQLDPIYDVIATDESLIAGLEWIAANGNQVNPRIRVVNMSLGRARTPEDTPDHPLHVIVKALYDSGISVVVSAGNDSATEVSQQVPASFTEVMAVASISALTGV